MGRSDWTLLGSLFWRTSAVNEPSCDDLSQLDVAELSLASKLRLYNTCPLHQLTSWVCPPTATPYCPFAKQPVSFSDRLEDSPEGICLHSQVSYQGPSESTGNLAKSVFLVGLDYTLCVFIRNTVLVPRFPYCALTKRYEKSFFVAADVFFGYVLIDVLITKIAPQCHVTTTFQAKASSMSSDFKFVNYPSQ